MCILGEQGGIYEIIHVRAAGDQGADVVGPVSLDGAGAVTCPGRTVPDLVVGSNDGGPSNPIVCLLGPVCIGLVARVSGESCCELEEASV